MEAKVIRVTGARQHNLQNVDVDIPRERLVVLTGLSGSGKSSLAFDTIYAEGQRRYVESLSVHARMFLEQVGKPDVERIEGLPPTLAIQQLATAPNPRSTVATTTEVYDFLRLLFARVGEVFCPTCATRLQPRTVDQIVDEVLAYPEQARVLLLAPLARGQRGDRRPILQRIQREGFVRARVNGALVEAPQLAEVAPNKKVDIDVVVDRLTLRPELRGRLAEAVELSLGLGDGVLIVSRSNGTASHTDGPGNGDGIWVDQVFSQRPTCAACGFMIPELAPRLFSFNSPYGACAVCGGLGATQRFDPDRVVPDESRSLLAGAIAPWSGGKKKVSATYQRIVRALCKPFNVDPETPFKNLPEDLRRITLHGARPKDKQDLGLEFEGVIPALERRTRSNPAESGRARFSNYLSERPCEACGGARLNTAALAVRVAGQSICDLARLSIAAALRWFGSLALDEQRQTIAAPIVSEIQRRVRFMNEVGLGYLTLDRASATLSGGEAQRIRLATQLGGGMVGVCYVLDEPTIGLHQRDNERLLTSIRGLVEIGNTVLVVEHDEDVIRAADHLIDMGPGAGLHGGRVTAEGPPLEVIAAPNSITGKYLSGEYRIPLPEERRRPKQTDVLRIIGARENNLKGADASIPLGLLCAVTGVSGSGKSTLISQTLLPALRRRLYKTGEQPGRHERLVGAGRVEKVIEIDQSAIGRSPRSNPATYTGVFDEIRAVYAKTKEARIRGYSASRFSFNARGGRCEACQGQGTRRIEMHFLPDLFVQCAECKGTRYNRETLEVRYRGKSIADVLEMRVEETLPFFDSFPKIKAGLRALSDVGLGYVRLGQPSNTLSGGEAQRVKLAAELAKPALGHTLYVLDEPTTGLHFADIHTLLAVLNRLVDMGNTVLVIEHNLDVIKTADWVIDLGPEGGDAGGEVVVEGTPEAIAACPASHTGRYLSAKLAPPAEARAS